MKKLLLLLVFSALLWETSSFAIPLDLSGFTAETGVLVSGGRVEFAETDEAAIYFYNDNFLVGVNDTILSFDYDFALGLYDEFDYLTFELNNSAKLDVDSDITGGHFEIDLSALQGQTVSLAWGLIWDGDFEAGTTAGVYNIDLASAPTPVPEPSTIILVGSSLAGLMVASRKKSLKKS